MLQRKKSESATGIKAMNKQQQQSLFSFILALHVIWSVDSKC